mmetsp:Transcript_32116/g.99196  ORF Transcript_32116/g.99196 Transcript_32116/m.99196 type:complete len:159 (+) Transcript_32116:230-706(+)
MSTTSKNETAPLLGKGGGTSNRASATGAPKFLVGLLAGLAIGALLGAKAGQHQARTEPTGLVTGDDCSKAKEGWSEFRRYTKKFEDAPSCHTALDDGYVEFTRACEFHPGGYDGSLCVEDEDSSDVHLAVICSSSDPAYKCGNGEHDFPVWPDPSSRS